MCNISKYIVIYNTTVKFKTTVNLLIFHFFIKVIRPTDKLEYK